MGRTTTACPPDSREQYRSVGEDPDRTPEGLPVRLTPLPSQFVAGSLRPTGRILRLQIAGRSP